MKVEEFLKTEYFDMEDSDLDRAFYILNKIPNEYGKSHYINPNYDLERSINKAINQFNIYKNEKLTKTIDKEATKSVLYREQEEIPMGFNMQFISDKNKNVLPLLSHPRILDDVSYAFIGHEFHHVLKDVYEEERKLRNRFSEVIPMFYELIATDKEKDEEVKREILNRRMLLLTLDKKYYEASSLGQLQYFNSYYYALCLNNKYKENPILVLRLVTRVLLGEITTLDLLKLLNIYDDSLNDIVDDEMYNIKEYIYG